MRHRTLLHALLTLAALCVIVASAGTAPRQAGVAASDYVLLHGNGVTNPGQAPAHFIQSRTPRLASDGRSMA